MIVRLEFLEFIWLQNIRRHQADKRKSIRWDFNDRKSESPIVESLWRAGMVTHSTNGGLMLTWFGDKILKSHSPWLESSQYISTVANHQTKTILDNDRQQLFCYGKSPLNK